MNKSPDLRFELGAYEMTDACRLASILIELASESAPAVSRKAIAERWAERYPRHQSQKGSRNVRGRISNVMRRLKVAGMVTTSEGTVEVISFERLIISAQNLPLLEDENGVALDPAQWRKRPVAPPHLRAVQNSFELKRLEAAKSLESEEREQ